MLYSPRFPNRRMIFDARIRKYALLFRGLVMGCFMSVLRRFWVNVFSAGGSASLD